jgi:diamine N-acetyltransferase
VTVAPLRPGEHAVALALRPHPHQAGFVASVRASLEEAARNPACVPLLIRAGGTPVGFAMHALDPDDGNRWIYRLLIDARHQRRGYGRAALFRLVALLAGTDACIMIGVHPANHAASRLYEAAGFRPTGQVIDGETIMRLDLPGR